RGAAPGRAPRGARRLAHSRRGRGPGGGLPGGARAAPRDRRALVRAIPGGPRRPRDAARGLGRTQADVGSGAAPLGTRVERVVRRPAVSVLKGGHIRSKVSCEPYTRSSTFTNSCMFCRVCCLRSQVTWSLSPSPRPPRRSAGVQVPLGEVADVRVVQGPSMIKSEDGLLRAYVQLNVRDRDVIGFVDEARRVVEDEVVARGLPQGVYLEWSGQFEHQVRARERLALIVPLVVFLIFVILYLTYQDLGDALLMMLAVPGALVGGLIFQALFDVSFSVAVWVGYIACFGLATETGIIMLVYLREAIERRGGLANIATVDELEAAVLEGAVQRLRPKLLTEGTTILGLVPMLMAEGVGAEVMRPMAAPVLGGVLLADEVIDVFIPVIFFWYRRRRWERLQTERAAAQADALEVTA
ncbi:MAG: efflux RND transporter permease subunit, partial [Planctomycetota bacterium]|nr:efflux RND transporter permease subunit [Planctomycetota bacterium]